MYTFGTLCCRCCCRRRVGHRHVRARNERLQESLWDPVADEVTNALHEAKHPAAQGHGKCMAIAGADPWRARRSSQKGKMPFHLVVLEIDGAEVG